MLDYEEPTRAMAHYHTTVFAFTITAHSEWNVDGITAKRRPGAYVGGRVGGWSGSRDHYVRKRT